MKDRRTGGRFVGMHLVNLLQNRGAIALAVVLISTLTAPAAELGCDSSANPPAYPDSAHVFNGCHLSTIAYLAQFKAQFPTEDGHPLVVSLSNADGLRHNHTVALITWQGAWWCRDEYFGVCPLGLKVCASVTPERLASRAVPVLEKNGQSKMSQSSLLHPPVVPKDLSAAQMDRDTKMAAQLIPYPSTIFWVKSGNREIPLVFFRPGAQQVALYNPAHGTSLAECASANDTGVVKAIAAQLGYRVDAIRADLSALRGTLVATNDLPHAVNQ